MGQKQSSSAAFAAATPEVGPRRKQKCDKQQNYSPKQQEDNCVRKLSNVSNRNVQLLSMRTRTEKDNYADNLRQRRRSSLINLILGAASSGPRFCDDLCSLSSHLSSAEQLNFGIEYFANPLDNSHAYCSKTASIASSLAFRSGAPVRPDNNNVISHEPAITTTATYCTGVDLNPDPLAGGHSNRRRRRRSSWDSFAHKFLHSVVDSPEHSIDNDGRGGSGSSPPIASGKTGGKHQPVECAAGRHVPVVGQHRYALGGSASASAAAAASSAWTSAGQFASIDLTSSFEFPADPTIGAAIKATRSVPLRKCGSELSLYSSSSFGSMSTIYPAQTASALANNNSNSNNHDHNHRQSRRRSSSNYPQAHSPTPTGNTNEPSKETRSIIMLQVCLPFIFAGFGNVAAGLILNWIAHWNAFKRLPIFFVLLPPFVGLKGNIEMTFASRLSTLAHLNLLDSRAQWGQAFVSNLILMLSQAIGLSLFASVISILCETFLLSHQSSYNVLVASAANNNRISSNQSAAHLSHLDTVATIISRDQNHQLDTAGATDTFGPMVQIALLVVLPSALCTSMILVLLSSLMVSGSIALAKRIQVNPDNFSTLVAALYGDASCVLTYGLIAELMYSINERQILAWPIAILSVSVLVWPLLWYLAFKFQETRTIALSSMPAIMGSISISIGSGAILSQVVERFGLIALYQPVVNGFGANLIAVQASRVSTWLWCAELRKIRSSLARARKSQVSFILDHSQPTITSKLSNSLASFISTAGDSKLDSSVREQETTAPSVLEFRKLVELVQQAPRTLLWSFCNSSPNSIAARLLLLAIVPAHSIYFVVIWLLSSSTYVAITWQFYLIYIGLCLVQVFVLLAVCEPLMTLLMRLHWDPDTLGISLLMALADLVGTLCLFGGFCILFELGDANAFLRLGRA